MAYLASFMLHILILYPFVFFAPPPAQLLDMIEISMVFEEPEPKQNLAEPLTTPEQPTPREEPRPDQAAEPDPKVEKPLEEIAKTTLETKIDRAKMEPSAKKIPEKPAKRKLPPTDELAKPAKTIAKLKPKPELKPKPKPEPEPEPKLEADRRPIHRKVPYLDRPIKPSAAGAIRAARNNEPRMGHEDDGYAMSKEDRNSRAAKKAAERYERAADRGYVMAQYNMARALAEGRGVPKDKKRAEEFFRNAARQGNVPAMLRLAEMKLAGGGESEDDGKGKGEEMLEAHVLYSLAANLGSKGAAKAKAMLGAHMELAKLEESRRRTRAMREMMPPMDLSNQPQKEQDLQLSAAEGNLEAVEELLQSGVDANAIDDEGRTPMIMAAWRGHHRVLRSLLDAGVDINAADNQGRTALSWAAINGYRGIIKTLLREAALVDVRGEGGLTPLMRAAWNGYEDIVADLIASKADVHVTDNYGINALRRAKSQEETQIIALLRAAGAR